MSGKPALRRLVVIRCHGKDGIGADILRLFGKEDCRVRGIGARTGDHGDAVCHMLYTEADHIHVLLFGKGGRFTRSPADDDGICAVVDLEIDEAGKFIIIN